MSEAAQTAATVESGRSAACLTDLGMRVEEAANKGELLRRCEAALDSGAQKQVGEKMRFFVPGRVEFLGKHTDYAGGRSLLCAVERGICAVARQRADALVRVQALDVGGTEEFVLSADLADKRGSWANYAITVARRVARNFPGKLAGADIAFASDLPTAAGMSSSSALIIAIFLALAEVNNLAEHPDYQANIRSREDLAGYLGTVENGQTFGTLLGDRGVGTFGGSQDHTAILCSQPGRLSQYAFCPVRREGTIPWPTEYVLAIGVSGVESAKTGKAMEDYNLASKRAAAIAEIWRNKTGRSETTVAAAAASSPVAADALRAMIAEAEQSSAEARRMKLGDRLEQFLRESDGIIPATAAALAAGQLDHVGLLVNESQRNAETLLGNQVPETVALCRLARDLGAEAASAFGAGFGGAVWAMVRAREADSFLAGWKKRYAETFANRAGVANFLITCPGPAAKRI